MTEADFAGIIHRAGGEAYIVGGWVRDTLRGVPPHDRDYVVTGVAEEAFCALFPRAFRTGRSFPVYRLRIDGELCEVAFARSEVKSGQGYRGFTVRFSPETTIEEDLYRRDTTMNSVAYAPRTGVYTDPFGGAADIRSRVIRATSRHFVDDPVRALRAARQAAQMGLEIEPGTIRMMADCREELVAEPGERLVAELASALLSPSPSRFFRALRAASVLDISYPWIHALIDRTQPPEHHPAGDAFEHTMAAVDRSVPLSERVEVRFAVLAHDLGKVLTPDCELPKHRDRDLLGLVALRDWNRRMTLPALWVKCAALAISEHMRAPRLERPGRIADLIVRLSRHPLGPDGMIAVIRADGKEPPEFLRRYDAYLAAMCAVSGSDAPEGLRGSEIGAWLHARRSERVAALMKRNGKLAKA